MSGLSTGIDSLVSSPLYPAMTSSDIACIFIRNSIDALIGSGNNSGEALTRLEGLQNYFATQQSVEDKLRTDAFGNWIQNYFPSLLLARLKSAVPEGV